MDQEEALATVEELKEAMHERFDGEESFRARLAQFDSLLGSVEMVVEHLYDEESREIDLAKRIVARETVHGEEIVRPPVGGRSRESYRELAGRS